MVLTVDSTDEQKKFSSSPNLLQGCSSQDNETSPNFQNVTEFDSAFTESASSSQFSSVQENFKTVTEEDPDQSFGESCNSQVNFIQFYGKNLRL